MVFVVAAALPLEGGAMIHQLSILAACVLTPSGQTLAALDVLRLLQDALNTLGYPAVTLFIMIQSSGIPFPGGTMLLLASFYAATTHHLQIPIIIACASFGAIVGDNIGYHIGRTGGKAIVERYGRYIFLKPKHLERAERFFAKHGDKTVFFGRFIAVLRPWSAFLAGVNHMNRRTFFIYNATSGILWATIYGLLGYYAGRVFHDNFPMVERLAKTVSWSLAGLIALVVAIIIAVIYIRRKRAK
jgi:membrane protein DedA with SNARE-associated domain